ncbi:hypothetical protein QBC34DRAFT_427957 [Podospora aff. communis PSN243]|uniref:Phase-specific protein n=1 Tax=Podospora aff. communis PSN243 TaxID=3040156 RepID=A0AAV9GG78_9PEZI|nr:hypothetical protein QBC34DRAFT_427957 [Podospora aff. communis PSN243]
MVSTKFTLLALAATLSTAAATGSAKIINRCPTSVYLHFDGPQDHGPDTITLAAAPGSSYNEPFVQDKNPDVGRAIIITSVNPPGAAKITFAYHVANGTVFYNLSIEGGQVLPGKEIVVRSGDTGACPTISWPSGTDPNPTGQDHTKSCSADNEIVLLLCASNI